MPYPALISIFLPIFILLSYSIPALVTHSGYFIPIACPGFPAPIFYLVPTPVFYPIPTLISHFKSFNLLSHHTMITLISFPRFPAFFLPCLVLSTRSLLLRKF